MPPEFGRLGRLWRATWQSSDLRAALRLKLLRLAAKQRRVRASGVAHLFLHNIPPGQVDAFSQFLDLLSDVAPFVRISESFRSPAPAFTLSFDDGFHDHATLVAPLLKRKGVPATLFVCTELVGLRGERLKRFTHERLKWHDVVEPLSPDDLKRWVDSGLDIGSHSVSHARFAELDLGTALKELRDSRDYLNTLTGTSISLFAWPFGGPSDFLPEQVPLAHRVGYVGVLSGTSRHRARTLPHGTLPRRQLSLDWGLDVCRYLAIRG